MVATTLGAVPLWCPIWSCGSAWSTFRGQESFMPDLMNRIYGYVSKSSSIAQLRLVVPIRPLREELGSWSQLAGKNGLPNYNKIFPALPAAETACYSARWFTEVPDRQREDPVILFFHGGGFALKLSGPHVQWLANFAKDTQKARVSILVLDYTVTPYGRFPQQLEEAIRCYAELSRTCDRIILMGDSCGGNLSLGLIQCLPVPPSDLLKDVPEKVDVAPWGMLLFSPWSCIVNYKEGSPAENEKFDVISNGNLEEMLKLFCDDSQVTDPRANPIKASTDVWKSKLPPRVACTWGEREVLRDSIRDWISVVPKTVQTFEQPRGLHDAMLQYYRLDASQFILNSLMGWLAPVGTPAGVEASDKVGTGPAATNSKRNWRKSWRTSWRISSYADRKNKA